MFEETDLVLNKHRVPSNISYKTFETQNLTMQNSYCDHRNFDSVKHVTSGFYFGSRARVMVTNAKQSVSISCILCAVCKSVFTDCRDISTLYHITCDIVWIYLVFVCCMQINIYRLQKYIHTITLLNFTWSRQPEPNGNVS